MNFPPNVHTALLTALAQYDPAPTHVRVCLHLKSPKEEKDQLALKFRQHLLTTYNLDHEPNSPYELNLFVRLPDFEVYQLNLKRGSLYLTGFYFKYSREVSQTPMFVPADGGLGQKRVGTTSVEEVISHAVHSHFYSSTAAMPKKQQIFLAGAGREDVDVLVLGKGRQFILTIENPTRNGVPSQEELFQLETRINGSNHVVSVSGLRIASDADRKTVLNSAEFRRKLYRMVVEAKSGRLTEDMLADCVERQWKNLPLVVHQYTPIRVSHRRSMLCRDRKVFSISLAFVSPFFFVMHLETGAGFYVKEFCHGDLGRTEPNLSDLLNVDVSVLALDFMGCSVEDDAGGGGGD